jgi:hypothetical protein
MVKNVLFIKRLPLIIALGAVLATAVSTHAATVYEGIPKDIEEARALSGMLYYHSLRRPLELGIQRGKDGVIVMVDDPWVQANRKDHYFYFDKEGVPKKRDYPKKPRTTEKKTDAVRIYERVIQQLSKERQAGENTKARIEMLGVSYPLVSKMLPKKAKPLGQIFVGYELNPSDLLAVAYLELALLKKDLGDEDGYRRLIADSVKKLKLLEIHYCGDIHFRTCIFDKKYNFARPETCLLFLAGENARSKGQSVEAWKHYMTLIERAPASPFAWEAMVELVATGAPGIDRMKLLKSILHHTYPLVWGCPRKNLKLDKDGFAAELPALLKKAGMKNKGLNTNH